MLLQSLPFFLFFDRCLSIHSVVWKLKSLQGKIKCRVLLSVCVMADFLKLTDVTRRTHQQQVVGSAHVEWASQSSAAVWPSIQALDNPSVSSISIQFIQIVFIDLFIMTHDSMPKRVCPLTRPPNIYIQLLPLQHSLSRFSGLPPPFPYGLSEKQ